MDTARADDLRRKLICNVNELALKRQQRGPLYDTQYASLSEGKAATKLGAGYDVLAPGKRGCPYHFHRAQEEMFIILEGEGSLRVANEMVSVRASPQDQNTRISLSTRRRSR